jgi:hypothetical protein
VRVVGLPGQLEQVEGEQNGLRLRLAAVAQAVEHRNAVFAANDNLAIDQA